MNEAKTLGQKLGRPDNLGDADLRDKLRQAIAAGDRDAVFGLAAALLTSKAVEPHADLLLTAPEVAQRLRVSGRTVSRLQAGVPGFPKPLRIGGLRRWRSADIDRFIQQGGPVDRGTSRG